MATSTSSFVGSAVSGTSRAERVPSSIVGSPMSTTALAQAWPTAFHGSAISATSTVTKPPGAMRPSVYVIASNQKRVGATKRARTVELGTEGSTLTYGYDIAASIPAGEGFVCIIGETENKVVSPPRALTKRRQSGTRKVIA